MKARVQANGLGESVELLDARSIVIYDDFDQPIVLVQKVENGIILQVKAGDPQFEKCLKALGIGLNATCKVYPR